MEYEATQVSHRKARYVKYLRWKSIPKYTSVFLHLRVGIISHRLMGKNKNEQFAFLVLHVAAIKLGYWMERRYSKEVSYRLLCGWSLRPPPPPSPPRPAPHEAVCQPESHGVT